MAFARRRPSLRLTPEDRTGLEKMRRSRSEQKRRTVRASILLNAADGMSDQANALATRVNRNTVVLCVGKCLRFGLEAALGELPRSGKPRRVSDEAIVWVRDLACQKPKGLGYAQELWTYRLLREHIRRHCTAAGHQELARLSRSKLHRILTQGELQPHQVRYSVERRDPGFEQKMTSVLHVLQGSGDPQPRAVAGYDSRATRGHRVLRRKAWHPGSGRDHAGPAARARTASQPPARPPLQTAGYGFASGRPGSAHRPRDRNRERHSQEPRLHRLFDPTGCGLPARPDATLDSGQPLRTHLETDPALPSRKTATLSVRVCSQARLLAEPRRKPVQQDGAQHVTRNPCDHEAGTHRSHSSLFPGSQRGPCRVPLEVQDGRDCHCLIT